MERERTVRKQPQDFPWTSFYEAVARKLMEKREHRQELAAGLYEAVAQVHGADNYLQIKSATMTAAASLPLDLHDTNSYQPTLADGMAEPIQDIDPFTFLAAFNRHTTSENRRKVATEIATLLGVDIEVPISFEGIPRAYNQAWFFDYGARERYGEIDILWDVFLWADRFASADESEIRRAFAEKIDAAMKVQWMGLSLTYGLFWSHPWIFPPLFPRAKQFVESNFNVRFPSRLTGALYLEIHDALHQGFANETVPARSMPDFALATFRPPPPDPAPEPDVPAAYALHDVMQEGCFLDYAELEQLLALLRVKKNLILQGAPGTGKTWLAKRLAYALIGRKDRDQIRSVQFHPNLSYEDFVRGWRPADNGRLVIAEGLFMEAIRNAQDHPDATRVVVIEEINRGNPALIFGELLTLLEADKRSPDEGLELAYPDPDGQRRRVYVPPNLYVIGTMNIADRSLALVDFALRRRFAFAALEPRFNDAWFAWVTTRCGIDAASAREIQDRMTALNDRIAQDPELGRNFLIGHSYVTPSQPVPDARAWFRQVAATEIRPLLQEYWFATPDKVDEAMEPLLRDG